MCSGYFFFSLLEHHYQLVIHQNINDPSRTTDLAYRRNDSDNILYLVLFKLWIIHANQRLLYLSKILKYIKWEGIIKCVHVIFSFHDWNTSMNQLSIKTKTKNQKAYRRNDSDNICQLDLYMQSQIEMQNMTQE